MPEKVINKINYLKDYFQLRTGKGFGVFAILFLALEALIIIVGVELNLSGLILPLGLALPVAFFIFKHPKLWIYTVVVTGVIFLRDSGEGLSVADVLVVAGVYISGLLYWLINTVLIKKIKIVKNFGDWMVCSFFFALLFNSIFAVLNGVAFMDWLREYLLFALTLTYFPIKEHFKTERELKQLLTVLMITFFIVDLTQLYAYYKLSTTDLKYAYELRKTATVDQALFTTCVASGLVMYFYFKSFKVKVIILLFTALSTAAIISTFSRTYWVIIALYVVIMFIYLPFKNKIRLASIISISTLLLFIGISIFFSKYYNLVIWAVTSRLESTTEGKSDISVQARLSEYSSAIKEGAKYPLSGNGLAKDLTYYDPIESNTNTHKTVHNAYVYSFYKWGIPLQLFYFSFLLYYLFLGIKVVLTYKNDFYKSLALCSVFGLGVLFIANFSSAQIMYRDAIFVAVYSCAFIHLSRRSQLDEKKLPAPNIKSLTE